MTFKNQHPSHQTNNKKLPKYTAILCVFLMLAVSMQRPLFSATQKYEVGRYVQVERDIARQPANIEELRKKGKNLLEQYEIGIDLIIAGATSPLWLTILLFLGPVIAGGIGALFILLIFIMVVFGIMIGLPAIGGYLKNQAKKEMKKQGGGTFLKGEKSIPKKPRHYFK